VWRYSRSFHKQLCVSDKGERASEDNKGTEDDEMADVELARDG
jgi:hypothetical protein